MSYTYLFILLITQLKFNLNYSTTHKGISKKNARIYVGILKHPKFLNKNKKLKQLKILNGEST